MEQDLRLGVDRQGLCAFCARLCRRRLVRHLKKRRGPVIGQNRRRWWFAATTSVNIDTRCLHDAAAMMQRGIGVGTDRATRRGLFCFFFPRSSPGPPCFNMAFWSLSPSPPFFLEHLTPVRRRPAGVFALAPLTKCTFHQRITFVGAAYPPAFVGN